MKFNNGLPLLHKKKQWPKNKIDKTKEQCETEAQRRGRTKIVLVIKNVAKMHEFDNKKLQKRWSNTLYDDTNDPTQKPKQKFADNGKILIGEKFGGKK